LDGKKSLEWGKKSLYGALSKPDKTTCAKVRSNREQVAMASIKPRLSLYQLQVKAAVSANMVEFFKKTRH
jgi:hypothetical protein